MTIVSGVPQTGKSHLAVNLAFEYIRRGRLVGLYHELAADSPIEDIVSLKTPDPRQRRDGDERPVVICRGYQGVDIVSCTSPLSDTGPNDAERLAHAFAALEVNESYDDFIVDTSSMPPHAVLACCLASELVTVLITPDPASQAGAFALLRVLKLNGYEGVVCVLTNKVRYEADAAEIRRAFVDEVANTLHIRVHELGLLLDDSHVRLAQGAGQAVTSCFPDSGYSDSLLVVADSIDELREQGSLPAGALEAFVNRFAVFAGNAYRLPGAAVLEPESPPRQQRPGEAVAVEQDAPSGLPVSLLQFDGELGELYEALRELPVPLGTLAADIGSLGERLSASRDDYQPHEIARCLERGLLQQAAVMLVKAIEPGELDLHHVRFRVRVKNLQATDPDWLVQGRYLRYEFLLLDMGDAVAGMQSLLDALPHGSNDRGVRGNTVYAWLNPSRNGCLSVIVEADKGVRIQVWSVADRRGGRRAGDAKPSTTRAASPARERRLH